MRTGSSAIVIHNKKILLLLRDNIPTISHPNKWSLPGGGAEKDETPEQTLLRELEEEICIRPKNIRFLGKYIANDGEAVNHIFIIKLNKIEASKVRLGNEGQELSFFSLEEFENIEVVPAIKESYITYKKEITKIIEGDEKIGFFPDAIFSP